jgi:hypothetical protein
MLMSCCQCYIRLAGMQGTQLKRQPPSAPTCGVSFYSAAACELLHAVRQLVQLRQASDSYLLCTPTPPPPPPSVHHLQDTRIRQHVPNRCPQGCGDAASPSCHPRSGSGLVPACPSGWWWPPARHPAASGSPCRLHQRRHHQGYHGPRQQPGPRPPAGSFSLWAGWAWVPWPGCLGR